MKITIAIYSLMITCINWVDRWT